MENPTAELLLAELTKIDPAKRLRWLDASNILRSIGTNEAERAWREWSAPLGLTDEIVNLWRKHEAPHCADPLAELRTIAKRRGSR